MMKEQIRMEESTAWWGTTDLYLPVRDYYYSM